MVQTVKVWELRGTKYYEKLKKAFEIKEDVPKLITSLLVVPEDMSFRDKLAEEFEEMEVHVERVVVKNF